jgi:hypothetical protein
MGTMETDTLEQGQRVMFRMNFGHQVKKGARGIVTGTDAFKDCCIVDVQSIGKIKDVPSKFLIPLDANGSPIKVVPPPTQNPSRHDDQMKMMRKLIDITWPIVLETIDGDHARLIIDEVSHLIDTRGIEYVPKSFWKTIVARVRKLTEQQSLSRESYEKALGIFKIIDVYEPVKKLTYMQSIAHKRY